MRLEDVEFYKYLQSIESPFLSNIESIVQEKTIVLANEIPKVFDTYTIHDINHSLRILQHCYCLVQDKITEMNELDIVILFYSAILHDIGMAVSTEELEQIKIQGYNYNGLKFSAMLHQRNNDEKIAMQDFIRTIHADRANDYVLNEQKNKYLLPNQEFIDFRAEVGKVCASHGKDFSWILKNLSSETLKGTYKFNLQFCSFILRLGDLLDFDSNRTPPILYKMIEPTGYGKAEWQQHFMINNFQKIIDNESNQKTITINGASENPKIHRKFLMYLKWIENEVASVINALKKMPFSYHFNLNPFLDVNITTSGYTFSDKKLSIDYQAITKLLMGEKIYGDKKLALREMIQNSIDACKLRKEFENNKKQYGDEEFGASIKIIINRDTGYVTIKDNGMGMTMDIVNNYFLNIGKSYYTSESFLLEEYKYKPIGNFGIGFLACFMLSDEIKIMTRYLDSENKISISLEKESEYITLHEEQDVQFDGTEILFNYSSFMNEFDNNIEKLNKFLNPIFLTDDFSIKVIDVGETKTYPIENSLSLITQELKPHEYILPLTEFLDGIEGSVKIKYNNNYINALSNINNTGNIVANYLYQDSTIQQIDDQFDISKIYYNASFSYIRIPIISHRERDEYEKSFDVLNDLDDVIDRVSTSSDWITIFYDPDVVDEMYEFPIEWGDNIIGELPFEFLIELGQDSDCATKIYTYGQKAHRLNNTYLPFGNAQKRRYYIDLDFTIGSIYLRNILLNKFEFSTRKELAKIIEINEYRINVINRTIIPSISRNDLDKATNDKLSYALIKAVHLSALKYLDLDVTKKSLLKSFINEYFSEVTNLES